MPCLVSLAFLLVALLIIAVLNNSLGLPGRSKMFLFFFKLNLTSSEFTMKNKCSTIYGFLVYFLNNVNYRTGYRCTVSFGHIINSNLYGEEGDELTKKYR